MKNIRAAVVGYGNIGKFTVDAILGAKDMELAGVVRRKKSIKENEKFPYKVVESISELENVDVALLGVPTRLVPQYCKEFLAMGINTVDSYDIHDVRDLKRDLDQVGKANNTVAVLSTGIDPGMGSLARALFKFMAPEGITHTNYGPGMSMGHSVAVKAVPGVKDALSLTIPKGQSMHKRVIYVELEEGADFAKVQKQIKNDDYFVNDETHIFPVDNVEEMINMGHKIHIEREGVASQVHNQRYELKIEVQNPAATAQVMVAAARASMRVSPGAYTMLEIPLIHFIEGETEENINKLI